MFPSGHRCIHLCGPTQINFSEQWLAAGLSTPSCTSRTPWTPRTSHPCPPILGIALGIPTISLGSWPPSIPWTRQLWTRTHYHNGPAVMLCIFSADLLGLQARYFIRFCGMAKKHGKGLRWDGLTRGIAITTRISSSWNPFLVCRIGGMDCFYLSVAHCPLANCMEQECSCRGGKW